MSRGIGIMFCWGGGGAQFFYKIKFVVYRTYRVGMAQTESLGWVPTSMILVGRGARNVAKTE